jgi:hypothetical protein
MTKTRFSKNRQQRNTSQQPVVVELSLTEKTCMENLDRFVDSVAKSNGVFLNNPPSMVNHDEQTNLVRQFQQVVQDLTMEEYRMLANGWSDFNLTGSTAILFLARERVKSAFPRIKTSRN